MQGNSFQIITLDGRALIRGRNVIMDVYRYDQPQVEYHLDLTTEKDKNTYILSNALHEDTALFSQICYAKNMKKTEDCLQQYLLFVDFKNMVRYVPADKSFSYSLTSPSIVQDVKTVIESESDAEEELLPGEDYQDYLNYLNSRPYFYTWKEDLFPDWYMEECDISYDDVANYYQETFQWKETAAQLNYCLSQLFENGIQIRFDETTVKTFLPYDKSQSMSRQGKMSFLDADLIEALDKRLLLDLDFAHTIKASPSKFYAYKGLSLSSGFCISEHKLPLNEETVIVLPDPAYEDFESCRCTYLTTEEEADGKHRLVLHPDEVLPISSPFDGEGLVSPAYGKQINSQLPYSADSASFQIRMPFTKGMLHTVDFHDFLNKYGTPDENGCFWIRDIYGFPRDLAKAQILLTKGMFKAASWLADSVTDGSDPMAYYFKKFHHYHHHMYVSGIDLPYRGRSLTTLNYQIINTLSLKKESFDALITPHLHYAAHPEEYLRKTFSPEVAANAFPWQQVLLKNKKAACNPYIRKQLTLLSTHLKKEIAFGHLLVSGEVRYLSRDLLPLLISLLEKSSPKTSLETLASLRGQCLKKDHFYLPGANIRACEEDYYTLFRNPHLSRNEQCALQMSLFPEDSLYETYFRHLQGILMVDTASQAPQILGGADFDGDLVKIVDDPVIRGNVLSNTYDLSDPSAYKTGEVYHRRLPIIKIPTLADAPVTAYEGRVDYRVIKNTFSNNIGRLSNLAAGLGPLEYSSSEAIQPYLCESCTIYTGIEIDAAKNGKRADLTEILQTAKLLGAGRFQYIEDFLNILRRHFDCDGYLDLSKLEVETDDHNQVTFFYNRLVKGGTEKSVSKNTIVYTYNENACGVNLLPYYFFSALLDSGPTSFAAADSDRIYFDFQKETGKPALLTEGTVNRALETASLLQSCRDICELIRSRDRSYRYYQNSEFANYLYHILKSQNPDFTDEKGKKRLAENLLFYADLCFPAVTDVQKAIEFLRKSDWPYLETAKEKEDFLSHILKRKKTELIPEIEYLYNFTHCGYQLLYLLLREIEVRKFLRDDTALLQSSEKHLKEKRGQQKENISPFSSSALRKHPSYRSYYESMRTQLLEASGTLSIRALCRKNLSGTDFAQVYGITAKMNYHSFIWDFYPASELLMHTLEDSNAE